MPTNLIGTGSDQVSVNGMLGDLAFQNKESLDVSGGKAALTSLIVKEINNSKNITAADVFVYDTSKDSDGGAWRKRTQHTSWYNEELNTATRGSRREFPAVAVIVATADSIIIYDGDDASLPMWMVFQPGGILDWPTTTHIRQYVTALNGQIVTVSEDGGLIFRYIDDYIEVIYSSLSYPITTSRIIGDRNKASAYAVVSNGATRTYVVLTWVMNDVAMTVLPGAPIDSATGLPVPTIAVATNSGVSVIHNNGTVANITETVGPNSVHRVLFNGNKIGFLTSGTPGISGFPQLYYLNIPYSNVSASYFYTIDQALGWEMYGGFWESVGTNRLVLNSDTTSTLSGVTQNACSNDRGLNFIDRATPDAGKGMVAYVTSKYNTGWMPGNIKGAWLSDTTQETIVSPELISNGTFDSNVTGWTAEGTGASISWNAAGRINVVPGTDQWGGAYTSIQVVAGKTYIITGTIVDNGGGWAGISGSYAGGTSGLKAFNGAYPAAQSWTFYHTATQTGTLYITIDHSNTTTNNTIVADNVSVRLADLDRSVNNKGLQVFGNIVKTPVATGADLVAYSGFSASNYLQQPYNSTLAAGTGTQTFIAWFKLDSTPSTSYLIHRGTLDSAESLRLAVTTSNIYFDYGGNTDYAQASLVPSIGVWTCIVATVTAGQFGKIYLNGKLQVNNTQFVAPSTFLDDSTYTTTIGGSHVYGGWFNGSIALARYSLSTISDQQVLKLYEDEKALFQDNAKAVLYGTSNAVTALAYDAVTEILHVGTSSGRSDFQGLRRIDNTTRPIGTAISAVDSFIVEE